MISKNPMPPVHSQVRMNDLLLQNSSIVDAKPGAADN
jgi:hypothetical protein